MRALFIAASGGCRLDLVCGRLVIVDWRHNRLLMATVGGDGGGDDERVPSEQIL